jgi:hypothetical protein
MPRARYGIAEALADIKQLHKEMQVQEIKKQPIRPSWQAFAVGFAIGIACFAGAIASFKLLGWTEAAAAARTCQASPSSNSIKLLHNNTSAFKLQLIADLYFASLDGGGDTQTHCDPGPRPASLRPQRRGFVSAVEHVATTTTGMLREIQIVARAHLKAMSDTESQSRRSQQYRTQKSDWCNARMVRRL